MNAPRYKVWPSVARRGDWLVGDADGYSPRNIYARYRGDGAELMARARAIVLNDEGLGRTNDAKEQISNGT